MYTYAGDLGWNTLNLLSSVGALVLALGVLLFFVDAARVVFKEKKPHGNPWNAPTLEWLPPGYYGLRCIPVITTREPLWDRSSMADEVAAGRYFLPCTHSGGRETLVTSWRDAEPRHLVVLPGDSWWPLVAAAGTAGVFLLLTVGWVAIALACGVTAIVAIVVWLWQSDNVSHAKVYKMADDVFLPVGAHGSAPHSWWAMVILLCVDATVFASLVFAHVHVAMAGAVCPPPGASLPAGLAGGVSCAVIGQHRCYVVGAKNARSGRCVRRWTGRLQPRARASLDNTALLWHYTTAQGLAAMGTVYLMPLL